MHLTLRIGREMGKVMRIFLLWLSLYMVLSLNLGCLDRFMTAFFEGMAESQEEHAEQDKANQLPGVYELWGLFIEDRVIHDMVIEAVGVSQLVLVVDEIVKVEQPAETKATLAGHEEDYLELTWEDINGNVLGTYGVQEPLLSFIDKKVRITGVIYDLCGYGLYLSGKTVSEVYCSSDPEAYIELREKNGDKLTTEALRQKVPGFFAVDDG
jgi:hypothetical protein